MTDGFSTAFANLKDKLDDPDARFFGEVMRDALLELVPLILDKASEARLFRELAVLEGKRSSPECLDHAERALAADEGTLTGEERFMMHGVCADVGASMGTDVRTRLHLDGALALSAEHARSQDEMAYEVGEFAGGRRVSVLLSLAGYRFEAGRNKAALAACRKAKEVAEAEGSPSDIGFAKEQIAQLMAEYRPKLWERLGFGAARRA